MRCEDLVNRIIEKLGGNRVEFLRIAILDAITTVEFAHAGNSYCVIHPEEDDDLVVLQYFRDQGPLHENNYSRWVEGVLNGKTRDESGVLA